MYSLHRKQPYKCGFSVFLDVFYKSQHQEKKIPKTTEVTLICHVHSKILVVLNADAKSLCKILRFVSHLFSCL